MVNCLLILHLFIASELLGASAAAGRPELDEKRTSNDVGSNTAWPELGVRDEDWELMSPEQFKHHQQVFNEKIAAEYQKTLVAVDEPLPIDSQMPTAFRNVSLYHHQPNTSCDFMTPLLESASPPLPENIQNIILDYLNDFNLVRTLDGHKGVGCDHAVQSLFALKDGRFISARENNIKIWNHPTKSSQPIAVCTVCAQYDGFNGILLSQEKHIIVALPDGEMSVWQPKKVTIGQIPTQMSPEMEGTELLADSGHITSLLAIGNGQILSGQSDGIIVLWTPPIVKKDSLWTQEIIAKFNSDIDALAKLPNGKIAAAVAAAYHDFDSTLQIIDLYNDKGNQRKPPYAIASYPGHGATLGCGLSKEEMLQFESDGLKLKIKAIKRDRLKQQLVEKSLKEKVPHVTQWEIAGIEEETFIRTRKHDAYVAPYVPSMGGQCKPMERDTVLKLLGSPWALSQTNNPIRALCALRDGRLISGAYDGSLRIWNFNPVAQDPFIITEQAHNGMIMAFQELSDGRIACGGANPHISIWDTTKFLCVSKVIIPDSSSKDSLKKNTPLTSLTILPDTTLVAGSMDGDLVVLENQRLQILRYAQQMTNAHDTEYGKLISQATTDCAAAADYDPQPDPAHALSLVPDAAAPQQKKQRYCSTKTLTLAGFVATGALLSYALRMFAFTPVPE